MKTFAEFHEAMRAIAGGKYFAVQVQAVEWYGGNIEIKWRLYLDGNTWTNDYTTPEGALSEMRARVDGTWVDPAKSSEADISAIGAPPQAQSRDESSHASDVSAVEEPSTVEPQVISAEEHPFLMTHRTVTVTTFAAYEAAATPIEKLREANKLLLNACKDILPFVAEDFKAGFQRPAQYTAAYEQLRELVEYATGLGLQPPYARLICQEHGAVDLTEKQYEEQLCRPNRRWACTRCGDDCRFDDEYFEALHCTGEDETE